MKIELFENDLPDNFRLQGDIAVDTEAMGLNIRRDRLCLVQICDENGKTVLVQPNQNYDAPNLKKLLNDTNRQKIFHFARFDVAILNHYLNIDIQNIFCTKIASKIARTYTDSHGLKELCRELLTVQISKQQQSSNWGNNHLTIEQQEYAAKDVIYLHDIRQILINMLTRENRLELALDAIEYLPTRVRLDLAGWENNDIFAH